MQAFNKVHIFDPGLGRWTGHWVNFNRTVSAELARRSIPCEIYGNQDQDREILRDLPVRPFFRNFPWPPGMPEDRAERFRVLANAYARDFAALPQNGLAEDLLLLPSCTPEIVTGAVRYWLSLRPEERPYLGLLYQFGEGADIIGRGLQGSDAAYFRMALAPLVGQDISKFRQFASSRELSYQFRVISSMPVVPLCMPCWFPPDLICAEPVASNQTLTVGYFGHASLEKGAQFLRTIIDRCAISQPRLRFMLHINTNKDTDTLLKRDFADTLPTVSCAWGHLDTDRYFDVVSRSDIVLMSYDRNKYGSVPSSVFSECALAGKIMVIPTRSWLAREAKAVDAGCVAFENYNAHGIFQALTEAVDQYGVLWQKARNASRTFLNVHHVGKFADDLLAETSWTKMHSMLDGWPPDLWNPNFARVRPFPQSQTLNIATRA